MSGPDGELRAAFLATSYGTGSERFRLAGQRGRAPSWARGAWAVVTAWNPGGRRVPEGQNALAGARLLRRIRAAGLLPTPAVNGEGGWTEEALIVPGARLTQAAAWGAEFGQAAVLWGVGARVGLVWLGPAGPATCVERFWAERDETRGV